MPPDALPTISDWLWRRKIRARSAVARVVGFLLRSRCQDCGKRERHSWYGNWWPSKWMCVACTELWMEDPDAE